MQDAFDLYHQNHVSFHTKPPSGAPALPALGHAIAGSAGAALSNLIIYPLALIITRQQTQSRVRGSQKSLELEVNASLYDVAATIVNREGGLGSLYTGLGLDTSKTIADSFLFFLAYTFIRQQRLRARRSTTSHLPVIDELGVGFLAGALSKFLTTPITNVVTRQQASSMTIDGRPCEDTEDQSARSIFLRILSRDGLQGLWSGYSASLVLTLNPSLTFFFSELFKRLVLRRKQHSGPSSHNIFLLAAISKALASTITYPFSLAKSRMQASTASTDSGTAERRSLRKNSRVSGVRQRASKNVFASVSGILREGGASALYAGLGGEILKGFLNHGITMLTKDIVHKMIIQAYFTILRLLRRHPGTAKITHKP